MKIVAGQGKKRAKFWAVLGRAGLAEEVVSKEGCQTQKLATNSGQFGQKMLVWPNLVWPNLVLAKVGLVKVGHSR